MRGIISQAILPGITLLLLSVPELLADTAPRGMGQSQFVAAPDMCGAVVTTEQVAYELSLREKGITKTATVKDVTYHVPVAFHVVRRSDGTGGIPPERLDLELHNLNVLWAQAGIQFFRYRDGANYAIHYINSDYYYNTEATATMDALRHESPVAYAVNVYYVPIFNYCGYSSYSTSAVQGIVMNSGCAAVAGDNSTLAHEIGHFFDLYHTHETAFGVECPDSSNCAYAGDLICDTPADPNLLGLVDGSCNYTGSTAPPPGCGGTYNPQTDNHMSYSVANCRDLFTPMQISAVRFTLQGIRSYLLHYDSTDTDGDGVMDVVDNCPNVGNPGQLDSDWDCYGDVCDNCPNDPLNDEDNDGICGNVDNCPTVANSDQLDIDGNGIGNACACKDGSLRLEGQSWGDNFGWKIRYAGDFNKDGYQDFLVGSSEPAMGGVSPDAGEVYLYSGKDLTLLADIQGESGGDNFGFFVGAAGDINKDGYGDIIVGAPFNDAAGTNAGRAYVFIGGPGPYPTTLAASSAHLTFTGTSAQMTFGTAVAGVGDQNNDGYDDVLVGAAGMNQSTAPGRAYIFSGADGSQLLTFGGYTSGDYFGYAAACAGRVDSDTIPDILIGAPTYSNWTGRAYLFKGGTGSLIRTFTGDIAGGGFAATLSDAGDINRDGREDVLIGAPWAGTNSQGKAFIYSGTNGALLRSLAGYAYTDMFGWAVCRAGDIDGDNYPDFAVGAPYADGTSDFFGAVYVYSGRNGSLLNEITGSETEGWYGRDIALEQDLNKDGVNDLLVGEFNAGVTDTISYGTPLGNYYGKGRVYLYYLGDRDGDGLHAGCDNCPLLANPSQSDVNQNGIGDACEYVCGDADASSGVDISDAVFLIAYIFAGGPEPQPYLSGDADCSSGVDISDAVYLIAYIFGGGPVPCAECPR